MVVCNCNKDKGSKKEGAKMETIKISIAAARVNAGMTQEEVAEYMHVSKNTIINWEKGRVTPSFAVMQTLANLFKFPIDNISMPEKST